MEEDRQRPYSLLTRDEVKEKMKKQIDEISEIFWVSRSDATVLLMYLKWDSLRVSERLAEDKEKLLTESGLKSVVVIDSDGDTSDSSFVIFSKTSDDFYEFEDGSDDDDNGAEGNDSPCGICLKTCDDLVSTQFCSHKFCTTCWREYLDKNFYSLEKSQTLVISCPDQYCRAAFGQDTAEKLTVGDKDMYESYILRSYLEGIKKEMIKQCPSPDCNYIIKFHQTNDVEEYGLNVVCLCGHTFCWRCKLESHRPVTCNNASDWLSNDLSALEETDEDEDNDYWISCVDKWKAAQISMKEAKSDLDDFDAYIIKKPYSLKQEDVSIVREGLMLIIQCRQVLKWSCVYEHLHTDCEMSKREYLRFLQENATDLLNSYLKTFLDETEGAFLADSVDQLCKFRHTLSTGTSSIGNYFYHFINTLQDGLADVKVKSYDDFGGLKWFCDRCTYGNTWLHKECQKCCDTTASPLQEIKDLSLN